ncbi:efflux transporter outer membrane subunit [Simkania negevensis]|uniref:Outer membrane protein n=1 Tax=Simkania negevensis (strain ATCC VR-1471 / DSM 27360 / Z) TaxID=331113 RepID=F8L725_SIMNZ|nr:efflux transporter outer membrane subunit [Simkania negevensis]CCB88540.1 outer membrane protein [Simkania negevensis Z]
MKNSKIWIPFLVLLTGCAVGPNYHTPEIAMPMSYETHLSLSEEEEVQLRSWWTQFEDPMLNVLIHEAISQNLDLKIALEKINQVRAQYQIKAAELAPKLDMTVEERRSRISQNLFDSTFLGPPMQNFYKIGFDASWEIDIFGKRRREKESAFYEYEAERENARDIYITLLGDVAQSYIEIRSLQHQIQITKKQIFIQRELLDLTSNLFEAGLASEIDQKEVQALLESIRASLPPLEIALKQTIHGLATLLGKAPENFENEFVDETPIPLSSQEIPLGLPSDLLRRRPDIRKAERLLAAATANIGAAIADLFPRFSLIGDYGFQSNNSSNWLKAQSRTWSIGPSMNWPILYFGRIRENIRAQNSLQEQALLSYEQTILTALEDVENSLVAYYKEETRRSRLEKEVEAKHRAYELKRDLYLSGLADFQTFLQADQDLLNSENDLISSTQQLSTYLVSLYKALGGEW